jgi:hypothetical protein
VPTTCPPTAPRPAAPPQERPGSARVIPPDPDALSAKIRIYLIADNLSAHKTPDIRQWAQENNVELVFTPTSASFLNRIECHFWAIGEFVVNNADYPDWNTFKKAMADHITYRNGPHRDQGCSTPNADS